MKRLSIRLSDQVHAALAAELPEWRKLRGPRFSLNNLCEEKLSAPVTPTTWYTATGTNNYTLSQPFVYTVNPTPGGEKQGNYILESLGGKMDQQTVSIQRRRVPMSQILVGIYAHGQFIVFGDSPGKTGEKWAQEALDQTKALIMEPTINYGGEDHPNSLYGLELGAALVLRFGGYPISECPFYEPGPDSTLATLTIR